MKNPLKTLFIVLAFVVALSACDPPGPVAPPTPTRKVDLFGDSLTVAAEAHYSDLTPMFSTTIGAFYGTTIEDWTTGIHDGTAPTLILALGTNDAARNGAAPWGPILDDTSTRCVVWLKTYEWSPAVASFNADLAALIAAHPNVKILDWNSRVKTKWIGPDGIHYNATGSDAYASALRDAAAMCP